MFIDTSSVPIAAPNNNSAIANRSGMGAIARNGRTRLAITPLDNMTRRQPKRDVNLPAIGMAMSDPMPRHSRTSPSSAGSKSIRVFANGTDAAQADISVPAAKKARRVDKRCMDSILCIVLSPTMMAQGDVRATRVTRSELREPSRATRGLPTRELHPQSPRVVRRSA